MKYTSIFLSASLLLCQYIKAQDPVEPSETTEITENALETIENPDIKITDDQVFTDEHGHNFDEKELTKEEHLENIVNHFFAILHAPHNLQDGAHHVAHIFTSIMHLAMGLLKQDPANKNYAATFDKNTQKRIAKLIAKKTEEYRSAVPIQQAIADLEPQENEKDDEVQVVLTNFAQIVANFFDIVKDPENPANVAQNIAGMIGNMINIAAQATKVGKLPADASERAINTYINSMDNNTKTTMISMITRHAICA